MLDRPKIIEVFPRPDYSLDIKLSDNRLLRLDMKKFLAYPAYRKLAQIGFFLAVKHDARLLYWDDMHIDQILKFATESSLQQQEGR